jgi:hypothetical protein
MEQPMQPLSAEKILALWETARDQHPLDRALTMLAAASPGASRGALADLSIGERDTRLLQLRTAVFGPQADAFAECPRCAERLEFRFDTGRIGQPNGAKETPNELEVSGRRVPFRLPTSRDLAETAAAPDPSSALRRLAERCVFGIDLPNDAIEALSGAILAADPQAEISLDFTCPACSHRWDLLFEIAEFLWTELAAQARHLLREIDALARAYGWTEREILTLPAQRRQSYMELVTA